MNKRKLQVYFSWGIILAGIIPNILSAILLQNPFYFQMGILASLAGIISLILALKSND